MYHVFSGCSVDLLLNLSRHICEISILDGHYDDRASPNTIFYDAYFQISEIYSELFRNFVKNASFKSVTYFQLEKPISFKQL